MKTNDKNFPVPKCLLLALAAMVFVVTGCPHNEYFVQLKPQGDVIERTLVFYRADGTNASTGQPNYQPFDTNELAAITTLYPAHRLTNDTGRYVIHGEFANELPADVGGAGAYTNLATSLGTAGFYVERFRGSDDLAGQMERRFQAADQLAELIIGWSQAELGKEPGYDALHTFLNVDFRKDLKNLGAYCQAEQLVGDYTTNAIEEFTVRFGQYLVEHGYITVREIPGLIESLSENNPQTLRRRIQRLVADKMGVPPSQPVPAALGFLADETALEKSFTNYLAGTTAYRAQFKQWEANKKLNPDSKPPEPEAVAKDAVENLLALDSLGQAPDHLTVWLALPAPPLHSNGRWDAAQKQVVWEADLMGRTNLNRLPASAYASWVQPAEDFQKAHFGKVALTGDELAFYCLWRGCQNAQHGKEWDAFLNGLKPGDGFAYQLNAFRFTDEPDPATANGEKALSSSSDYPRNLINRALP